MSNTIDIYKPTFMLRMVEQLPPMHRFLKDTFFSQVELFPTESVLLDVVKNGMAMAPFVSTRIGNTVLERDGYETKEFTPALIAPMRVLTTDDLNVRLAGESLINGYHPRRRQAELLQKDMIEIDHSITRREEWMASRALFEGKIIVVGQGVNKVVDFGFENDIIVDVEWSDFEKSDPLRDLLEARKLISRSGYSPNIMIADSDTINNLLDNERVQKMLDNSGMRIGVIEPQILQNGAHYYGYLRQVGLHIYSYDGEFADNDFENPDFPGVGPADAGFVPKVYNLVPKGKVFVGSTDMPCSMLYGIIKNIRDRHTMASRVPNVWYNDKGTIRFVDLSSRPLPCPKNVSAWAILDVGGGV